MLCRTSYSSTVIAGKLTARSDLARSIDRSSCTTGALRMVFEGLDKGSRHQTPLMTKVNVPELARMVEARKATLLDIIANFMIGCCMTLQPASAVFMVMVVKSLPK